MSIFKRSGYFSRHSLIWPTNGHNLWGVDWRAPIGQPFPACLTNIVLHFRAVCRLLMLKSDESGQNITQLVNIDSHISWNVLLPWRPVMFSLMQDASPYCFVHIAFAVCQKLQIYIFIYIYNIYLYLYYIRPNVDCQREDTLEFWFHLPSRCTCEIRTNN